MGLLGNYDDIETNDFQTPGGDIISHDASLQDIYYMFGIHCKSTLHIFPMYFQLEIRIWKYIQFYIILIITSYDIQNIYISISPKI